MCGRYSNHLKEMTEWADLLGDWPGEARLSRNIAPTQVIPVLVKENSKHRCRQMRWGLVPAWSDTAKPRYATFNARAESVDQKPAFRQAFAQSQSCLIPAAAYYEWQGGKGNKVMYSVGFQDRSPLLMAGLWSCWQQEDKPLYSCTILTRAAVPALATFHPRMPLLLDQGSVSGWLSGINAGTLENCLHTADKFEFNVQPTSIKEISLYEQLDGNKSSP